MHAIDLDNPVERTKYDERKSGANVADTESSDKGSFSVDIRKYVKSEKKTEIDVFNLVRDNLREKIDECYAIGVKEYIDTLKVTLFEKQKEIVDELMEEYNHTNFEAPFEIIFDGNTDIHTVIK